MNNQKLKGVALEKAGHPRSRFNFSHDVNTTADFGSVQPAQVKLMVPYSKGSMSTRSLTRLAPMVAPAFGRVKFKLYHQFVACKDVCKTFDALMSQTPYYHSGTDATVFKGSIPNTRLSFLTVLCLIGARVTMYKRSEGSNGISYTSFDQNSNASVVSAFQAAALADMGIQPLSTDSVTGLSGDDRLVLPTNNFGGSNNIVLPLSNAADTWSDALGNTHSWIYDLGYISNSGAAINDPITLDEADLVWEAGYGSGQSEYVYAFRLSSVGKRLRKILIGCGYQLDLSADTEVSVLPLFAFYKAYWNLFGLTQWQNYETTPLAKLIDFVAAYNVVNFGTSNFNNATFGSQFRTIFLAFLKDLCFTFYTESVDYVSSHLPSTAVSKAPTLQFVDVTNNDSVQEVDSAGGPDGTPSSVVNGHAFIKQIEHGELDAEYLKRLYKWVNRNTVIGRRIGEILRAQGLGKFVDSCKTDFIGYTEDLVQISDVISQADTHSTGNVGKYLGEYGGRGLQFTQSKNFTYENDEFGYWITLMVIVPECGYMQQLDPTILVKGKFDFYNPDFDSMGFEAQTKRIVQGARDWNFTANTNGTLDATFGYAPRYFGFKFAQNVNNGDITRRGSRDGYLPYTLDKFIDAGSPRITRTSLMVYTAERQLTPNDLPIAGNAYRYIGRYPWMGNFNRIFANTEGDLATARAIHWAEGSLDWWFANANDNFLISSIFNFVAWSPMLAVEDSFETEDEDGKSNMTVSKA